jgi:hypothetical protein
MIFMAATPFYLSLNKLHYIGPTQHMQRHGLNENKLVLFSTEVWFILSIISVRVTSVFPSGAHSYYEYGK